MISVHRRVLLPLLLLLVACKTSATSGTTSDARITAKEGKSSIAFRGASVELPQGDVVSANAAAPPTVMQDDAGKRLAYRTASGQARLIYVVGSGLFLGPLAPDPPDFRAAPDVDHALAPLFEAAATKPRRADLLREVRAEKGEGVVVRLLIDAAYVDDPSWDEGRKTLSKDNQKAVADAVAIGLEKGKSPILLRRAVDLVDIRDPDRAKTVAARAKELANGKEEPRAVSALLRAVLANDPKLASSIGCDVLTAVSAQTAQNAQNAELDVLVDTALLTVANARLNNGTASACTDRDADMAGMLLRSPCVPYLRCSEAGEPLLWADTSKQDEALCTKAQLANVVKSEVTRATKATAPRPELYAYAALIDSNKLPASLTAAHARRRYLITQSAADPLCDSGITPGTACHCDEATLRAAVCRAPVDAASSANGFCSFAIDDKQKKILNVVAGVGTN